ncbi:hypothetical protein, partial [Enterococcus casseliflavus]|uniref:hypothetical protein n=1 Tax=Enterococcus casseliflavus TaxID=37734 RepID=UPI003D0E46EE
VAAGTFTRAMVLICSDLLDRDLPNSLRPLVVNVLLVPALSESEGGFNAALADVASHNQGIAAVTNGSPPNHTPDTFMVLAAVPRT